MRWREYPPLVALAIKFVEKPLKLISRRSNIFAILPPTGARLRPVPTAHSRSRSDSKRPNPSPQMPRGTKHLRLPFRSYVHHCILPVRSPMTCTLFLSSSVGRIGIWGMMGPIRGDKNEKCLEQNSVSPCRKYCFRGTRNAERGLHRAAEDRRPEDNDPVLRRVQGKTFEQKSRWSMQRTRCECVSIKPKTKMSLILFIRRQRLRPTRRSIYICVNRTRQTRRKESSNASW